MEIKVTAYARTKQNKSEANPSLYDPSARRTEGKKIGLHVLCGTPDMTPPHVYMTPRGVQDPEGGVI